MTIRQTIHDVLAGLAEAVKPPSDDPADEAAPAFAGKNYRDLSYDIAGPALGPDRTEDLDELRAIKERMSDLSTWVKAEAEHATSQADLDTFIAALTCGFTKEGMRPFSEVEERVPFQLYTREARHLNLDGLDLLWHPTNGHAVLDDSVILCHFGNMLRHPDQGLFPNILHVGPWVEHLRSYHRMLERERERHRLYSLINEMHAEVLHHTPVAHLDDVLEAPLYDDGEAEPAFADQA